MALLDFLKLPESRNIQDLDAPETTLLHRKIIQQKPLLKNLYLDFYSVFEKYCPQIRSGFCVELGSGGGFLKEIYPLVTTSDILKVSGVDLFFSGLDMPFEDGAVDGFVMLDVFHHVPDSHQFLQEMRRCLKPGGRIVMIEPANTVFGRFIYKNFHHEAFDPWGSWQLPQDGGPLSCANGALPWIVFSRDREKLRRDFTNFKLLEFKAHTPLRYLLSGGVSMRALMPSWMEGGIKFAEALISPLADWTGLFYTIVVEREAAPHAL